MPDQAGDKRHEATPHRRQKAREQGQVARSQDLASALLLISSLGILLYFGGHLVGFLVEYTRQQLGTRVWSTLDRADVVFHWQGVVGPLGRVLMPLFGLMMLSAIAVHLGQIGFLFLPEKLTFDFDRINPLRGFQRIFSLSGAMRLAFGIFKVLVVAIVAFWCLWLERDTILGLTVLPPLVIAHTIVQLAIWTCLKIGVALLLLAILDYAFQRWKYEQDLRMTTQEVREELKTLQGDPQVLARRRAVQRQLTEQRIATAVPQADVVVTNPTELAIAIKYDMETMEAPIVVAKGAGTMAQRIRRLALEHEVPVVERKELAQVLYKRVDVGKPIPPEQYAAMAEVLRYVYQLKGQTLPSRPPTASGGPSQAA